MTRQSITLTRLQTPTTSPLSSGLLQRKCACGQRTIAGGECAECQKKRSPLQRRSVNRAEPSEVPPIVHEVLRSPGQLLDNETRAFMESRFEHDFSQVRVHTDTKAAESARAVNALAYTVRQDVVFGAGQFSPGTAAGQKLLAHELAHTIQQDDRYLSCQTLSIGKENSSLEKNADTIADQVMSASLSPISIVNVPPHLQRTCGSAAIGSVSGCIGVSGQDITDVGVSSNDLYRFKINCDEFLPGEAARFTGLASTISVGDTVDIHGFASEEGDPTFNVNLSCARAHAAANLIGGLVPVTLFQHGATPGPREDRRSVVIVVNRPTPTPSRNPVLSIAKDGAASLSAWPDSATGNIQGYQLTQNFRAELDSSAQASDFAVIQWITGEMYEDRSGTRVYWPATMGLYGRNSSDPWRFTDWIIDSPDADPRFGSDRGVTVSVPITTFSDSPGVIMNSGSLPAGHHWNVDARVGIYRWGAGVPTTISGWESQRPQPLQEVNWGWTITVRPDLRSLDLSIR